VPVCPPLRRSGCGFNPFAGGHCSLPTGETGEQSKRLILFAIGVGRAHHNIDKLVYLVVRKLGVCELLNFVDLSTGDQDTSRYPRIQSNWHISRVDACVNKDGIF
jgi:hypothetical protein